MSLKRICLIVLLMCSIHKSYSQTLPPLCDVLNPIDLGSCLYTVQRPENAVFYRLINIFYSRNHHKIK